MAFLLFAQGTPSIKGTCHIQETRRLKTNRLWVGGKTHEAGLDEKPPEEAPNRRMHSDQWITAPFSVSRIEESEGKSQNAKEN